MLTSSSSDPLSSTVTQPTIRSPISATHTASPWTDDLGSRQTATRVDTSWKGDSMPPPNPKSSPGRVEEFETDTIPGTSALVAGRT